MRVLIVEDDAVQRRLLEKKLLGAGHEVRWATTVGAAQLLLDSEPFGIVLLDVGLGHEDGLDVARYMRAKPSLRDVDIVVISGLSADEVRERATSNVLKGKRLMLPKPLGSENLEILLGYIRAKEKSAGAAEE